MEKKVSVDVKEAVKTAVEYLSSLLGDVGGFRLEEVEQTPEGRGWLVTLSFVPLRGDLDYSFMNRREYKQVEINGSGQPVAMRIRKVG